MRYFYLIFLMMIFVLSKSNAQNLGNDTRTKLVINLLIDADQKIMVESRTVAFNEISSEVKRIIYSMPATKFNGVEYRIFGDESLSLGTIMDVEDEMFKAYRDENTSRKRYILNIKRSKLDNPNWTSQIHKLDLRAIED